MKLADYTVELMIQCQGTWTVEVDDNGIQYIRNRNGIMYGVREKDGTIVTVETLMKSFNEKIKIEV